MTDRADGWDRASRPGTRRAFGCTCTRMLHITVPLQQDARNLSLIALLQALGEEVHASVRVKIEINVMGQSWVKV